MFEAMVFILCTGIPWRDLVARYGPWNSVYTRSRRWCQAGLWTKLLAVLARNAQGKLRFLDASHVKVHQDASNPAGGQQNQAIGRTKGGFNIKISAWVQHPSIVVMRRFPRGGLLGCERQCGRRDRLNDTSNKSELLYPTPSKTGRFMPCDCQRAGSSTGADWIAFRMRLDTVNGHFPYWVSVSPAADNL
jgi:hypothetical protein